MQAIVLAAGRARRMQPISDQVHKALLPVGGSTILGRIVDNLKTLGVRRLTVVTGYRAQDVRGFLDEHYGDLDVRYVYNSLFDRTNNIVSLAMAFDSITFDEDVILCECDLLLDEAVLSGLERNEEPNIALVDRWRPGMDGTVVTVRDGFVDAVYPPERQGPDFSYSDTFKTLNVYRFSASFIRSTLHPLLSAYASSVDDNCYYEVVLAMLASLPRHRIAAHVIGSGSWIEVDDPNDLENARFHFEPQSRARILDGCFGGHWNFDLLDYSFIANAYFPPPALIAMMRQALPELLANYGSAQAVLNRKMALFVQCDPKHLQVLNGASQAFPILHRLWTGAKVAIPRPTFGEYPRHFPDATGYADRPGTDMAELDRLATSSDHLIVVNPNNPTGTVLATGDLYSLASSHPHTTLLVDESFIAVSDQPSIIPMLEHEPLPNVAVLTSLSKVLGVPGLRLGFLYSHDQTLLHQLGEMIPVWNSSSLAEFFIEMLIKFRSDLEGSIERTRRDRDELAATLGGIDSIEEVRTGGGDFVLVTFSDQLELDGPAIRRELLEHHRIEVKDVSARFTDRRVRLRLAVRSSQENGRLVDALVDVIGEKSR
jgi:histidinol-phosphate/aromatic aminotransferase/cobyric acid decarboxylase-like protein/choline kinase